LSFVALLGSDSQSKAAGYLRDEYADYFLKGSFAIATKINR
jgi:hypothetical protein